MQRWSCGIWASGSAEVGEEVMLTVEARLG